MVAVPLVPLDWMANVSGSPAGSDATSVPAAVVLATAESEPFAADGIELGSAR
jgi:hypothetical protein